MYHTRASNLSLESTSILKDAHHKQTGVRGVVCAIRKLQKSILAEQFSIRQFMSDTVIFAYKRLNLGMPLPERANYTKRST
ncbi:uncharacterized protein N7482_004283 [Penicillium canariense]|uniref:Uncharacterized protein n=1 Tax=Penicillium canariense TaxID=189055 RepID=A0A9W9I635_9EURO|nr:uncharacterized protein N7482_004283 [Penicillium canariense]KAJ5168689.1 hypothetical protein N7482_004283 [Penicillium canariense]